MSGAPRLPAGVTVLERGWLSSNNIVFASGVTAVVDSGYVAHAEQTVALVNRVLGHAPLQLIVSTHLHSDHCGGNRALQLAHPHARTLIPPGQADAVRAWDESVLSYAATGQRCEPFGFDAVLRPGESVRLGELDWQVHAAPGHDPHSIILFQAATRTLISADALWENGFGVVFPELDGEAAFDEVAATLDVIESLEPLVVIPGHGGPFGGESQVAAALERARSRLRSFSFSPTRHAAHAMKVLVKFKLLEWQRVGFDELRAWAKQMPYMRRVHTRFGGHTTLDQWLGGLVEDLVTSGALGRDGAIVYNI